MSVNESLDGISRSLSNILGTVKKIEERQGQLAEKANRVSSAYTEAQSSAKKLCDALKCVNDEQKKLLDTAQRLQKTYSEISRSLGSASGVSVGGSGGGSSLMPTSLGQTSSQIPTVGAGQGVPLTAVSGGLGTRAASQLAGQANGVGVPLMRMPGALPVPGGIAGSAAGAATAATLMSMQPSGYAPQGGGSKIANFGRAFLGVGAAVGAAAIQFAYNATPGYRDAFAFQSALFPTAFAAPGGYNDRAISGRIRASFGTFMSGANDPLAAAAIFTSRGMGPASNTFTTGMREAAFGTAMTGMSNMSAATGISALQSGSVSGRLGAYGIFTNDLGNGNYKGLGGVIDQLWGRWYGSPSAKVDPAVFEADLLGGFLGADMRRLFGDQPELYNMIVAGLRLKVKAGGKSGIDFSSRRGANSATQMARSMGMNEQNAPWLAQGQLYESRYGAIDATRQPLLQGMQDAIGIVRRFNQMVEGTADSLAPLYRAKGAMQAFLDTTEGLAASSALATIIGAVAGAVTGGMVPPGVGGGGNGSTKPPHTKTPTTKTPTPQGRNWWNSVPVGAAAGLVASQAEKILPWLTKGTRLVKAGSALAGPPGWLAAGVMTLGEATIRGLDEGIGGFNDLRALSQQGRLGLNSDTLKAGARMLPFNMMWNGLNDMGDEFRTMREDYIDPMVGKMKDFLSGLTQPLIDIQLALGRALADLPKTIGDAITSFSMFLAGIPGALMDLIGRIQTDGIGALFESIGSVFNGIKDSVARAISGVQDFFSNMSWNPLDWVNLKDDWDRLWASFFSESMPAYTPGPSSWSPTGPTSGSQSDFGSGNFGGGTFPARNARGTIGGTGTSTSDSIRANLSKGEYVVNARAAQAVGIDTLDAINSMGHQFGSGYASPAKSFAKGGDSGGGSAAAGGSIVDRLIKIARTKLGASYVAGADGPDTFDCSGFTQWAYKQIGINLNDVSYTQVNQGQKIATAKSVNETVSWSLARPGDLLFFDTDAHEDDPSGLGISHVAIYTGGGNIIHAWGPPLAEISLRNYSSPLRAIRRILGASTAGGASGSSGGTGSKSGRASAEAPSAGGGRVAVKGHRPMAELLGASGEFLTATSVAPLGKVNKLSASFKRGDSITDAITSALRGASGLFYDTQNIMAGETAGQVKGSARKGRKGGAAADTGNYPKGSGPQWLYDFLTAHGLRGDALRVMWTLGMRESGGTPDLVAAGSAGSWHYPDVPGWINWNSSDSPHFDTGVWQINNVHLSNIKAMLGGNATMESMIDPENNFQYTKRISGNFKHWTAWGLASDGRSFDWSSYSEDWRSRYQYGAEQNYLSFYKQFDQYNRNGYSQGAWRTSNEMARIHEGEMIIPAAAAEEFRAMMRDAVGGGKSATGDITINVSVQSASEAEAVRFANTVKRILKDDARMESMRSR